MNKTWFVISDGGYGDQISYRSIFTFSSDSLFIEFLGADSVTAKIQLQTDSTIEADSLPLLNYGLKNDTLKLSYMRSPLDTITLTLLPFRPHKANTSIVQLESLLLSNNWLYEYEGMKFDATFLNKYYNAQIRRSEIQVYYDDRLDRTLEMSLWKIKSLEKQLILIIENPMDDYYANVFYIDEVTTNGNIKASTWQYGSKYDIIFKKHELIDSIELVKKWNKLIASWDIHSSIEEKGPEIDTNYIDLGRISIWGEINMKTIIEESDLANGGISFNFSPDSSYQLLKGKSVICNGTWELQRNGRVVKLTTNFDFSDEYQTECSDFLINKLTDEALQIEHWIPVYESDSTVPNRYYELKMLKRNN